LLILGLLILGWLSVLLLVRLLIGIRTVILLRLLGRRGTLMFPGQGVRPLGDEVARVRPPGHRVIGVAAVWWHRWIRHSQSFAHP